MDPQPFSEREALGQYWMKDLDQGAFRGETYVAHLSKPPRLPPRNALTIPSSPLPAPQTSRAVTTSCF